MSTPSSSPLPSSAIHIQIVDALSPELSLHATTVMSRALDPAERDDRYEAWPTKDTRTTSATAPEGFVAVMASLNGEAIGYLGGGLGDNGVRQLDALIDTSALLDATQADPTQADPTQVERGDGGRTISQAAELLIAMLGAIAPTDANTPPPVELWGRPARTWHNEAATVLGLRELRALYQMRCRLPVSVEPIATRDYTPSDLDALRSVNNRAFASHPDQGNQSEASMLATMNEPWFRPEGVRLHEREGRLAGFCWTKIHPSPPAETELGEIYVIGVDPDFHGQGLGVPMTAAGLAWLAEAGITTGMLYVEADNVPAIKTYERLGFTVLRTDRAWTSTTGAADRP